MSILGWNELPLAIPASRPNVLQIGQRHRLDGGTFLNWNTLAE